MKAINSFDDDDDKVHNEVDAKQKEKEMAFLNQKQRLQRILKEKRNSNNIITLFQKKIQGKNEWESTSNTFNTQPTCYKCKKSSHFKPACLVYLTKKKEKEANL